MKPNNTRLWLAALLALSISGTSLALPTDRNQPIHISADTATIDDNTGITTYTGNVEIAQGTLKINARNVDLHRNEAGVSRILATGSVQFQQQAASDKPKHRGIAAVAGDFMLNLIAYNLVRIPKLIAASVRTPPGKRLQPTPKPSAADENPPIKAETSIQDGSSADC
jgi:hypothetical protein